jgi:hypothetical protein
VTDTTWKDVAIIAIIAAAILSFFLLLGCQAPQPTQPVEHVCSPCPHGAWPPEHADCLYCVAGSDCVVCDERVLLGWPKAGWLAYWCPAMSGCLAFGGPRGDTLSETCLGDGDVDLEDVGRCLR